MVFWASVWVYHLWMAGRPVRLMVQMTVRVPSQFRKWVLPSAVLRLRLVRPAVLEYLPVLRFRLIRPAVLQVTLLLDPQDSPQVLPGLV